MSQRKHQRFEDLPIQYKSIHKDYEYYKHRFVLREDSNNALVSIYEIPPLKSAYPYHYHLQNEETFYILSGEGILKTPYGEETVVAGDMLFFPVGIEGAHKLTNTSSTEKLVYIDFDVIHDLDVAVYPDSQKIGIWGKDVDRVFPLDANVDYYEGE